MKLVKTRCRNSLQNEGLLMVLINGPSAKACSPVVVGRKHVVTRKKKETPFPPPPPVKITKVPLTDNSQTVQQEDSQPDIGALEPAEPILDVFFCCSSSSSAESLGGSS